MAEIKSSIELAMERTKGLTFTEQERRELEQARQQRTAQILVSQYLRGEVDLQELDRKGKNSPGVTPRALAKALVEALDLGQETLPRALEALEHWMGKDQKATVQRLKDLVLQWSQALQKKKRKLKARLREELARRGVEGSAVEPNVEGSPAWESSMAELKREFSSKLEDIQQSLMAALAEPRQETGPNKL
ncbi:MAG: hypothetical protein ACUVS3_02805 [Thermodesulfobacteriota bacterium]